MNERKERVMPKGKKHWSFRHGLSGKRRSAMNARELEIVRRYNRNFMRAWRRKRNAGI